MKKILQPGVHWLYAFLPFAIYFDIAGATAPLVFFASALAIVPISVLIGDSTEHLTRYTSDAAGGLLTATFGNLPEIIIGLVALRSGLYDMLLAALAGSIIANLLLVLGIGFLVSGIKFHTVEYNVRSVRVYSSMMLVAIISLMVPGAFDRFSGTQGFGHNEKLLHIGIALTLLTAYILYLIFMLKTHANDFRNSGPEQHQSPDAWSLRKSLLMLLFASSVLAFLSEILVGAAEQTGKAMGLSSVFVGVIFVAMVGAAGSIPSFTLAAKGKMDLSIAMVLGSSIQIAIFVAPLLSILSLFIGPSQMPLDFSRMLLLIIFLSLILGTVIIGDGVANWYKGVQLIIMYLMIAMMFFFAPH